MAQLLNNTHKSKDQILFWRGMQSVEERVILLVDLDYFYAQCEENRSPQIKGKPVVIGVYSGRTEESGAVSTANYLARKHGVKAGMPIFLAKKRLEGKEAVFLPVDHEYYDEVSNSVMKILRGYADNFEQVSIDEAYLDISNRVQSDFERAAKLAETIKRNIKDHQGLTCSIGVGPNKLVAKIAADIKKPDGLTTIKPGQVKEFLTPLLVDQLLGVGKKTKEKMEAMGIKTIGDLAEYNIDNLIEEFGKKMGSYFHSAALGIDDTPVKERGEPESLSKIFTLKEDTRDLSIIETYTNTLSERVNKMATDRRVTFRTVGIIAVLTDMSVHSRSKTLSSPTNDLSILKSTVYELLSKLLGELDLDLRRIGVKISNFVVDTIDQEQMTSYF